MNAASQPTGEVAPAVLADYGAICRKALQGYLAVQGDRRRGTGLLEALMLLQKKRKGKQRLDQP